MLEFSNVNQLVLTCISVNLGILEGALSDIFEYSFFGLDPSSPTLSYLFLSTVLSNFYRLYQLLAFI